MSHKRLWTAAAIIATIILVGFVLSVPHTRDIEESVLVESVPADVPLVTLRDSFKKGVHTITGSLEAPNACAAITTEASLVVDKILVALSLPEDSGVCLQVPMQVNFTVTVTAPAQLPIVVTVNGAAATTTSS